MAHPRTLYITLSIASAFVLVIGLLSAVLIYQAADRESTAVLLYEQNDGASYPVSPYDSKKYLRDMELYGGKANLLMAELRLWLAGLWQGKSLAYMAALISVLVSFALFYTANRLARPPEGGPEDSNSGL